MSFIADALFNFFASMTAKFLQDTAARFIAYKALIFTFITVTVPVIVKNLVNWLFLTVSSIASTHVDTDGLKAAVIHFTGVAGYLATHLLLADCLAIIMAAVILRFVLNFIPFVG